MITLHFLLLLSCPLFVALGIWRSYSPKPENRRWVWPLFVAALTVFIGFGFNQHLCREGVPTIQWGLPGLCAIFSAFVESERLRKNLLGYCGIVGIALSFHFTEVVHQPDWTGNPDWAGGKWVVLRMNERMLENDAELRQLAKNDLPAGWIEDVAPGYDFPRDMMEGRRRVVSRAWHTWLTRLYRTRDVPAGLWYPGGPWEEGVEKLEIRDR